MKLEDLVVTKFDTASDDLVENLPYVLEKTKTMQRQIAVLRHCEPDALSFATWTRGITITPENAKLYNIYKADLLTDEMYLMFKGDSFNISASHDISEEKLKEIKDAVDHPCDLVNLNQSYGGYADAKFNLLCRRMIDYRTGKTEGNGLGVDNFYEVKSDVTIIKQFLYKVTRVVDNFRDQIKYQILLPTSEKDKMHYMDRRNWKIHPMFYNKENGCYMPTVRIKRPVQIMTFPDYVKERSITLQILSGLQLLHFIEYGLNEKDKEEPGMYAGIDYTNHGILISNAYTDESNRLVIDDEKTVLVKDISGYISRFLYWNSFDWLLFFPKETTRNVSICDSVFTGPTMGVNNIVKWGSIDSDNFGIFSYWMRSTEASENDYIIPWEFGEY